MFNILSGVEKNKLTVCAVFLTLILLAVAFLFDSEKFKFNTRCIAIAGVSLALSVGLSFVKIFVLPQGGSVTLASVLPMLLFGFIYGTRRGVMVGLILGVINFIANPWFLHPAQVLMDYVVAYAFMGLCGMFNKVGFIKNKPVLSFVAGSVCACILRFVCHVVAGVFAWETPVWASALYNSYVFVDLALSIIIGVILLSSKSVLSLIEKQKTE